MSQKSKRLHRIISKERRKSKSKSKNRRLNRKLKSKSKSRKINRKLKSKSRRLRRKRTDGMKEVEIPTLAPPSSYIRMIKEKPSLIETIIVNFCKEKNLNPKSFIEFWKNLSNVSLEDAYIKYIIKEDFDTMEEDIEQIGNFKEGSKVLFKNTYSNIFQVTEINDDLLKLEYVCPGKNVSLDDILLYKEKEEDDDFVVLDEAKEVSNPSSNLEKGVYVVFKNPTDAIFTVEKLNYKGGKYTADVVYTSISLINNDKVELINEENINKIKEYPCNDPGLSINKYFYLTINKRRIKK